MCVYVWGGRGRQFPQGTLCFPPVCTQGRKMRPKNRACQGAVQPPSVQFGRLFRVAGSFSVQMRFVVGTQPNVRANKLCVIDPFPFIFSVPSRQGSCIFGTNENSSLNRFRNVLTSTLLMIIGAYDNNEAGSRWFDSRQVHFFPVCNFFPL